MESRLTRGFRLLHILGLVVVIRAERDTKLDSDCETHYDSYTLCMSARGLKVTTKEISFNRYVGIAARSIPDRRLA